MRRNAFTLIELLIVMVVIAILSTAMMMSSEQAANSARAAQIINDLNTWKNAALAYWADNQDEITASDYTFTDKEDKVKQYIGVDAKLFDDMKASSNVKFRTLQTSNGRWYIWNDIGWGAGKVTKAGEAYGVAAKLAGRSKTAGLFAAPGNFDWLVTNNVNEKKYYGAPDCEERVIIMRVR